MPPAGGHGEQTRDYYAAPGEVAKEKKDTKGPGIGGMVAAGVGSAALGALAANALSDSSDDGEEMEALKDPITVLTMTLLISRTTCP